MKQFMMIAAMAFSLSACGGMDIAEVVGGPTVSNYKPPVIDETAFTEQQKLEYPAHLSSCQSLANSAITDAEKTAMLYSDAEFTRVTEKRRAIRRVCLQGRGFTVLY